MVADALRCKLASDDRLGRLAALGAPGAADAVCERFREPLARYCRALVGDPEDAQEATQVALERAVLALRKGEAPRALRPWLYRIAHNASMDVVRRRRPHAPLDEVGEDLLADLGDAPVRDQLADVLLDLRGLPERQRGALLLRELAGLSYDELAGALGTTAQAARQSVFEARAGLVAAKDGRGTPCDTVRRTISDGDRRTMRSRSMRAHLDDCGSCRAFAGSIRSRSRVLGLLPVPWAATLAASAAGAGTGATGLALGGWGTMKATAAIAAALTATAGSVATVERLADPPARKTEARAQAPERDKPAQAKATSDRAAATLPAASATSAPTRTAVPAARRQVARHATASAPASARTERRRERAATRRADRERARAEAETQRRKDEAAAAPAPTTSPVSVKSPALDDVRRRTEKAVSDVQSRTRETLEQLQTRTREALEQARTATQQHLEASRRQTEQTLTAVSEATRKTLETTRDVVQQVLSQFTTPTTSR